MKEIRNGMPCAYITKNKQRVKQFNNTVYLNNGDEFEIEIYNPLQINILAKITIQGNATGKSTLSVSNGIVSYNVGLVVRPGQRVFLERHLDDNKKFVFETYEVSKSNATLNAIAKNGDIRIEFFTENPYNGIIYNNGHNISYYDGYLNTFGGPSAGSVTTTNLVGGLTAGQGSTTTGVIGLNTTTANFSNTSVNYSSNMETGRVEKGSRSEQELVPVNMNFSTSLLCSSSWKILPMSERHTFSEDIKTYCRTCGTKRKKDSYKFCPSCGTKFSERKETEIIYINETRYHYLPEDKVYFVETYNMSLDKFLEKHKNKLIVIHTPSLTPNQLRAIVIED